MAHEAKSEPFRITVNDQHVVEVHPHEAMQLDVVPDGPQRFHVLQDGRAFRAEVMAADYARRSFSFRIDGLTFTAQISDFYARLVQQMGLSAKSGTRSNIVKAPMPGLVLQVLVAVGQPVQKGDPLLILEAMKMENVLKAAADGTVRSIEVQPGQAVEKGAPLIALD